MLSALRDEVLALACLRYGVPATSSSRPGARRPMSRASLDLDVIGELVRPGGCRRGSTSRFSCRTRRDPRKVEPMTTPSAELKMITLDCLDPRAAADFRASCWAGTSCIPKMPTPW